MTGIESQGGRFGLGFIRGEADIHPDDWFITCHFSDDPVMPGTLMYECCMHTLRVFLLSLGWVGEEGQVSFEPLPGVQKPPQVPRPSSRGHRDGDLRSHHAEVRGDRRR